MKRTTDTGIRTVAVKTINCKICGDEQQVQIGSACHRETICILCANEGIKKPRRFGKKFEVR